MCGPHGWTSSIISWEAVAGGEYHSTASHHDSIPQAGLLQSSTGHLRPSTAARSAAPLLGGSHVLVTGQGWAEVLQWLGVHPVQQLELPAEQCEVCEDCVEVGVHLQGHYVLEVGPVQVRQHVG